MAIDQCGNMSESSINFDIITFTPTVTLSSSYYTDPALLSEGCGSSMLTFELPVASTEDQVFYYSLEPSSPTFFNGYDIELLPGYVEFPAGVTSVDVDIVPLLDDLEETLLYCVSEPKKKSPFLKLIFIPYTSTLSD